MPDDNREQKNTEHKKETENIKLQNNPKRVAKKTKVKLSAKRIAFNIVAVVLGIIFIVVGSGCIVVYSYFNRINYKTLESSTNTSSQNSVPSGAVPNSSLPKVNTYDGTLMNDPMILNIMLFGEDTRADSNGGNSDTMILLSIDTRHKKLKLLSFMRDTYVEIPGYQNNKLNAAYSIGGASLSVNAIQANYGIQIDRYAVVDFSSFKNIIDTLGGIDVELTADEIEYINWQYWINNQAEYKNTADPEQKEYVRENLRNYWLYNVGESEKQLKLSEYTFHENSDGEQVAKVHLNGRQALWHSRNRGEDGICSGDDYTRTQRQRNVLGVIINKMKSADITKILSIIYEIGPMITTNLKTSEITSLATNITKYLNYEIESKSAPELSGLGTDFYFSDADNPIYIDGYLVNCIVINDWDNFRTQVADFVFENQPKKPESESSISEETAENSEISYAG
ncbi:MAG: LCP family protein [Clostridia bacterium]|nr:LCP family protein [Clostridia bacterium]